jgi:HlyD family secretion protein
MFAHSRVPLDAVPFQDPIDEVCAQPAPAFLRATHYLVVSLFIVLLLIASLTKVDVVVVAPGRLATATPPVVLQPMERAIVRELRVRPGDAVTKGEVVATLDPTFAKADAAAIEKQHQMLRSRLQRLEGEAGARSSVAKVESNEDDELQTSLLRQRQAEYATRLRVFDEDVRRLLASVRTLDEGRGSLGRELEVAKEVERMRVALVQSQSGSKLNLLDAQAARMRAERNLEEATNRLSELRHSVEARNAERRAFVEEWQRDLLEKVVDARADFARVTGALEKASRLHDLVVMTAPTDGIVLNVASRAEGSVVREAEPLLTIVPKDAVLIAEVMIASSDIGHTNFGAESLIKIDAFPYQLYGMVSGRLQSVSEESVGPGASPESAALGRSSAYHRGRIELHDRTLEHMPPGARLFPGMTLMAEINAGSRSVLSYFLDPLTRGLRESFREP